MQLKNIDWSQGKFEAAGKTYFIEKELSIQRSVYAEACKIQLESGIRMGKQVEDWKKVYELANNQKFADIAVMAHNNQRAFKSFFKDEHPVLRLCACFLNTEDEDRRLINDDIAARKINDWAEEGYAMSSFFGLMLSFLQIEAEDLKNATESILNLVKEFNQMTSEGKLNTPISAPSNS